MTTISTVSLSARRAMASPVAARAPVVAAPAQRGSLVVVAASKKKDVRLIITLECTEQKESGVAGMSRYMTEKVSAAPARPRNDSQHPPGAHQRLRISGIFHPSSLKPYAEGFGFSRDLEAPSAGSTASCRPGPRVSRAAKDASRPARSLRLPTPGSRCPSMEHPTDDAPPPNPPPPILSQNRRNTSQRVELMKYNPYLRKHTLHRELKK